jgi:phosphoenolpyruvate synthase/pyruvate phosphate dikinase
VIIKLDMQAVAHETEIGGKSANLAKLSELFNVPEAFIISADEDIEHTEVLRWFDALGATSVAVRSSATNEDGAKVAWAGQLETKLSVGRTELIDAIKNCRFSAQSSRALAYSRLAKSGAGSVAVMVQRMLDARVSGVAFTRHPVTKERAVVIEAVLGLGDALVSGLATPETIVVSNGEKVDLVFGAGESQPLLVKHEIAEVAQLARAVERELGYPVDIEWAYEGPKLYLLQARPITTL